MYDINVQNIVQIETVSGTSKILEAKDKNYAERIIKAITEAHAEYCRSAAVGARRQPDASGHSGACDGGEACESIAVRRAGRDRPDSLGRFSSTRYLDDFLAIAF